MLQFADGLLNGTELLPYPGWTVRHVAMSLYDAQRVFHDATGDYASSVADLELIAPPGTLDGSCTGSIMISVSDEGQRYTAEVPSRDAGGHVACIRDDRLLRVEEAATRAGISSRGGGRWNDSNECFIDRHARAGAYYRRGPAVTAA